ncbi:MOSC N-terminal beta barrel domain-containing protein [Saccharopolyspora hirsuta]|uniref:MOSC domain-containing protein n=1 Tax=Saccharopolyspora hirsuta TaxID=1837 RepID=A0A5M7C6D5_SACHI|nr:MOSC N-terminal beta barrel domain-containing protein [Saccharopolyspora hirsuta]KAA5837333.1 MOSC domain-containing protein [Saccharopolyspora hirsuta]
MARGTVSELTRWPVKSLRGEPVRTARFDHRGMAGDRAYALRDERPTRAGNVLTVRQNPDLLGWSAAYGDTADPAEPPQLRAPDGTTWTWEDPKLPDALTDSLGIPLSLHAADGQQDRGPTVLVTFEASRAALGEELGAEVDLRRFRTNLHITTDLPAFAEEQWEPGATITAGEVELTVTGDHAGPCIRCAVPSWDAEGRERWRDLQTHLIGHHDNKFGVIMRVAKPGEISRGDAVGVR